MRKVVYRTESNDYEAKSLRELRTHVEFFNRVHKCNDYDGDYVHRYVYCQGSWVHDFDFYCQINVVNGRVILRRAKAPLWPYVPYKLVVKP